MSKTVTAIIIIVVVGSLLWLLEARKVLTSSEDTHTINYSCNGGKTIAAVYKEGEKKASAGPDMPPTPGGSVLLSLSDGRELNLPQTLSADGTRYANKGESIIFWSKGNGAFMTEDEQETYSDCIDASHA